MKHVLFVGNSHLASLKLGWDDLSAPGKADIDATFFGMRGRFLEELNFRGSEMMVEKSRSRVFSTAANKFRIDLASFDAFVVVGMDLNLFWMVDIYRDYRTENHRFRNGYKYDVSQSCFDLACTGSLKQSEALGLADRLVALSSGKVILCPQPFPTHGLLRKPKFSHFAGMVAAKDNVVAAQSYSRSLNAYASPRIEILEQPAETLQEPLLTRTDYTSGSIRLSRDFTQEHPKSDFMHMNPAYGAIMAGRLLAMLTAAPAGA